MTAIQRILTFAGLIWLAYLAILGIRQYHVHIPESSFDSDVWRVSTYGRMAQARDGPSVRQKMIRDLVTNILPGKSKSEIVQLLGAPYDTPEEKIEGRKRYARRTLGHDAAELRSAIEKIDKNYSIDRIDWDLGYDIGVERIFIWDHNGVAASPDEEILYIQLDSQGRYKGWYIDGSKRWPKIVGKPGNRRYVEHMNVDGNVISPSELESSR